MSGEKTKVRVVVRVRPQQDLEDNLWVQVINPKTLQTINHRNTDEALQYEFQSVYGPEENQKTIYTETVEPMLKHMMSGRNASIFAYGPTGAGKTHTILGTPTDPGVIPRSVKSVFELIDDKNNVTSSCSPKIDVWEHSVYYSYMEIYNEKVIDLLDPKPTDLPIREDAHKHIFVVGLKEQKIESITEFNESFGPASKNRTTASTKLNERSSRSHSILLLKVVKKQNVAPFRRLTGKLYIIDLAGSEDNRRTGNQGVRLKESGAINSSLLALGQVVEALNRGQPCVPYRASKLTRLLQDSLGGNADTCMIVNLAPEESHYFDTFTTLHFARKTKKIVNHVKINESFEKQALKPGFKRSFSEASLPSSEPPPKRRPTTPTKPVQTSAPPAPFLSPLLRKQAHLREEMLERLQELEGRIMQQITASTSDQSTPDSNEPDSTTDEEEPLAPVDPEQVSKAKTLVAKTMTELMAFKDKIMNNKIEIEPEVPQEAPVQKGKRGRPAKKGKVYADGSQKENSSVTGNVVSCSPLFKCPAVLRRKGFKSTAKKISPLAAEDLKEEEPTENGEIFNDDAQKAHNERILNLLNTGNVKDLQSLQTVGAKRAQLIYDWRILKGYISSFDDLSTIHGLSEKYISTFLKNNLVR